MANFLYFQVQPNGNNQEAIDFEVVGFEGHEAISQSYEFKFDLRSELPFKNVNFLGKRAVFTIQMDSVGDYNTEIQQSKYHGLIFDFTICGKIKDYYYYKATLAPKIDKLKYSTKSDVYIEAGLPEILNTIFNEHGLSAQDQKLAFNIYDKKYQSNEGIYNRYGYVCQYEESDLNFINRLLERDGVYYYFNQTNPDCEQMIVTDRKEEFLVREKKLSFRFTSDQSSAPDPNAISYIELRSKLVPKQVTIMNFGYEKANLGDNGVISSTANVSINGSEDSSLFGEVFIYGENFINPDNQEDGKFLASIRAQEIYSTSHVYTAKSTVVPINAGMKIKIEDQDDSTFNGDYTVIEIFHRGQQQLAGMQNLSDNPIFYENTLTLIPAQVQFRPQRRTPWPKIEGTMNALIDGETGNSYPFIDSTGRYKVRLPFLKEAKPDAKGSIWLRMATPFAGDSYGFNFPLYKGTEVVLSFRNGNPDLPVIMSAVFNSAHKNVIVDSNSYIGGAIITNAGNIFAMNDRKNATSIGLYANDTWHEYK